MTPFKPVSHSFFIDSLAYPFDRNFSSKFAFDGELHDFTELVFIKSGKVELVKEEKIYLAGAGTLLFHAPMEFHKIKSADGTSPRVFNLSMKIQGELPPCIYEKLFSLDISLEEKFLSAFKKASAFLEGREDETTGELAALELQSLILDICRRSDEIHESLSTVSANQYKAVILAMENELYSNTTLEKIAKSLNISRSYLKMLFAKYCDLSPKEYYRKLRLRECISRLREGESVSQIAEAMNFSYPNHFTEFFKKETGLSPTAYRARFGTAPDEEK